jgi:predicted aminopeptidase
VHRAPVREVLRAPGLSTYRKLQLERVGLAKRFAKERLGLNDPGSYEHLCLPERKALSWVVSACPADSLRPHTWWFPLVGEVPYKGFFDPREADEEARNLASRGLVTHVRPVEAYSLLGWLPDPLYTPMLDQSPERLVEVILHELTHATVYVPGRSDFNEAFATFVGRQGARLFWATGWASGSISIAELERQERLRDHRTVLMRDLVRDLEDLFTEPWSRDTRLGRAEARLRRAAADLGRQAGASPPLTLAEVSLFRTYDSGSWAFERMLAARDGDLRTFIRRVGLTLAEDKSTSRVLASWQTPSP